MDRLTLDTSILRDWAWVLGSGEIRYQNNPAKMRELSKKFERLRHFAESGICEIGITNILLTDFGGKLPEEITPAKIGEMIGPYVEISHSISVFPMTFPFSFADPTQIDEILHAVFPEADPNQKNYENKRNDALQLHAHLSSGRDIFIASDKRILEMRNLLKQRWGINILTLDDYLYMFPEDPDFNTNATGQDTK